MVSFCNGMQTLTDAIAARLKRIELNTAATALARGADGCWKVTISAPGGTVTCGARTVVHSVHNFQVLMDGADKVTCHWFLMLYGADGKPVLPTHPPIQIAYMTDKMVRSADGGWLVAHRTFDTWFEGGTPVTNPNLNEK